MWTIGREREKLHAAKFVKDEAGQTLLFRVIDAVHDLKDGGDDVVALENAARCAIIDGNSAVWQNVSNWIRRAGQQWPAVLSIWPGLAAHADWRIRHRVACVLYLDVPEDLSNRLFAALRFDKSAKVRQYVVQRYEWRPDEHNEVKRFHDAALFDERFPELS